MRYLLSVMSDEDVPRPTGADWDASLARVGAVIEEMQATGVWVFADGPFAETKEQLGGFWIIEVADLDEALRWAGKCAEACWDPIEVRPFDELSQT